MIDDRAFAHVKREDVIIQWVYKDEAGRTWNVIASHTDKGLDFLIGPCGGGHWGHEARGGLWPAEKVMNGEFPEWAHTPEGAKTKIQQFLKDPESAKEKKKRFLKKILGK